MLHNHHETLHEVDVSIVFILIVGITSYSSTQSCCFRGNRVRWSSFQSKMATLNPYLKDNTIVFQKFSGLVSPYLNPFEDPKRIHRNLLEGFNESFEGFNGFVKSSQGFSVSQSLVSQEIARHIGLIRCLLEPCRLFCIWMYIRRKRKKIYNVCACLMSSLSVYFCKCHHQWLENCFMRGNCNSLQQEWKPNGTFKSNPNRSADWTRSENVGFLNLSRGIQSGVEQARTSPLFWYDLWYAEWIANLT